MIKASLSFILISLFILFHICAFAQNVGIGITTPAGRLHVQGSEDVSQLIIDADTVQSNSNPLIKLRNSDGTDLIWIHSDHVSNLFLGLNSGYSNVVDAAGTNNTFVGSNNGPNNTIGRDNTSVGANALLSNTTTSENTAIGVNALYTQSFYSEDAYATGNVAVGFESLYSNQPTSTANGVNNTAVGRFALRANTTGWDNTAIGATALYSNTSGFENTATGRQALFYNTMGIKNTATGYKALRNNISGYENTADGAFALHSNDFGERNTANGMAALYQNTLGSYNTADGAYALYSNIDGGSNTAIGSYALQYNTGHSNIAQGVESLKHNTSAGQNIAIGNTALFTQSFNPGVFWSSHNVAIGHYALFDNQPNNTTSGIKNTAVGNYSLTYNTTGAHNTASGFSALYSNTTGIQNTATGHNALYANISGSSNTANGYEALDANITGTLNSAFGRGALNFLVNGIYNSAFGAFSGVASGIPYIYNTVSIGNDGYLNGASNQAFLGGLSTTWTGGQTTWFTYASDARVKNDVQEDVIGLEFISRLRPVTYHLDITAMREITGNADTRDYPEKYNVEKIQQSGFIAQEVEQAASETGYNFSGITIPRNEHELYTMSYAQFVVPLVKAVQELNVALKSEVENLKSENAILQSNTEILTQRIDRLEALIDAKR